MQEMQEMGGDRIIVGQHFDALAAVREVMPVAQHRSQARQQPVSQVAGSCGIVPARLRHQAPQRGHPGAQHVHGMAGGGQLLEHRAQRRGQCAQ